MEGPYSVSDNTTVGEPLFVVRGAEQIFVQHGCEATIECTEEWVLCSPKACTVG